MALREFPGVLWLDSSTYFVASAADFVDVTSAAKTAGMALLTSAGSRVTSSVTHSRMFAYLPVGREISQKPQRQAGIALYYRSHRVIGHIIRWYVYCALDDQCIAPNNATLTCNDATGTGSRISGKFCHRYDQSAINIIASNYYDGCKHLNFYTGDVKVYRLRAHAASLFSPPDKQHH